jgi:large subunit ribosomal protein L10
MLGKLQQTGAQVQVQDGSIHVMEPATMVEAGEEITADDAEILNQLGIEPLKIGLDLVVAYSDGEVFDAEALDIDTEKYRKDVETAASQAFNLAVNAGYITETTAPTVIAEAVQKAKNLSTSEGLPEEESVDSQIDLEEAETEDEEQETEEESEEESAEEEEE